MHPLSLRRAFFLGVTILTLACSMVGYARASGPDSEPGVQFFFSETCPHCRAEQSFLDTIEEKYPALTVARYPVTDPISRERLRGMLEERNAKQYFGTVPITFVGPELFVGFDNAKGRGAEIEAAVLRLIAATTSIQNDSISHSTSSLPTVSIPSSLEGLPLPIVAAVLGFLDGFNVCSLGALALILGLVLVVRDRKRVIVLGGTFILTTALVYGVLITLWYRLFAILGSYVGAMQLLIGIVAAVAGFYFLAQFWRVRRYGPTCGFSGGALVVRVTKRVQNVLGQQSSIVAGTSAVLFFASVITIVEFPCSAAVPLVFAGMLAESGASALTSLGLIGVFVLMYLIDELIVFGIAVSRMRRWMSSGTATKWALLMEAIILIGIGGWYVAGTLLT